MSKSKSNLKLKVAVVIACLLLMVPASVAQAPESVLTRHMCRDGHLVGFSIHVATPGTYTFVLGEDVCYGRSEARPRLVQPDERS